MHSFYRWEDALDVCLVSSNAVICAQIASQITKTRGNTGSITSILFIYISNFFFMKEMPEAGLCV